MALAVPDMPPFPFLKLPADIRFMVYDIWLRDESKNGALKPLCPQILATCSAVYREANPVFAKNLQRETGLIRITSNDTRTHHDDAMEVCDMVTNCEVGAITTFQLDEFASTFASQGLGDRRRLLIEIYLDEDCAPWKCYGRDDASDSSDEDVDSDDTSITRRTSRAYNVVFRQLWRLIDCLEDTQNQVKTLDVRVKTENPLRTGSWKNEFAGFLKHRINAPDGSVRLSVNGDTQWINCHAPFYDFILS